MHHAASRFFSLFAAGTDDNDAVGIFIQRADGRLCRVGRVESLSVPVSIAEEAMKAQALTSRLKTTLYTPLIAPWLLEVTPLPRISFPSEPTTAQRFVAGAPASPLGPCKPVAPFKAACAALEIFASVIAPFLIFAALTALFFSCLVPTEFLLSWLAA